MVGGLQDGCAWREFFGMLKILYYDADIVAVDKPAGMLSVPGKYLFECAAKQLASLFTEIHIVHRLDQDTSGLLLFALNKDAQRAFSHLFHQGLVEKEYVALVQGRLRGENGQIRLPLRRDMSVSLPPKNLVDFLFGKHAATRWQVESYDAPSDRTRLRLFPKTGRSHQLRVHCLSIGHPIVGDPIYNSNSLESRMFLHAHQLRFTHPRTNAILELVSAPAF